MILEGDSLRPWLCEGCATKESADNGSCLLGLAAAAGAVLVAGALSCDLLFEPDFPSAHTPRQCSDSIDNDQDGLTDYPDDPGCESPGDPSEEDPLEPRACSDGLDNDGDGLIDFGQDPGCLSASDDDERNLYLPQCGDYIDNDGDNLIDMDDPDCEDRNDDNEWPD